MQDEPADICFRADLSKIDWSKCDEFALKNIVKLVCETKNELKLNKFGKGFALFFNFLRALQE